MHFNKKGEEGNPTNPILDAIISIVIGVILLLALLNTPFVKKLFGILGEEEEKATMNNFNELVEVINGLNNNMFERDHPYFISNNFILVGFNNDTYGSEDECGKEIVLRPSSSECKDSACLCVYPETATYNDFDATDLPKVCRGIDVDYLFTLDYYDDKLRYTNNEAIYKNMIGPRITEEWLSKGYYNDEYARLFIYGQCENWSVDKNFGVNKLYIEKVYDEQTKKTFLFIAENSIADKYVSRLKSKDQGNAA